MKALCLFFLFYTCFLPFATAQNIFSSHDLDYKKSFAPYDLQNVVALEDQEMILLLEDGKSRFKLVRYDKYFFDKWSTIIDYKGEGSFPQLFKLGDEVVIFRLWNSKGNIHAEVTTFDRENGNQIDQQKKILVENNNGVIEVEVGFSEDRSKFVIYNFQSSDGKQQLFEIYNLKDLTLQKTCALKQEGIQNKAAGVFLKKNNDLFIVRADAGLFNLHAYFFGNSEQEPLALSGNFSLKRPAENIKDIKIVAQSPTTYFVITPAYIENELVGINVSSFNVVLKTLLFSNTYDFDKEFIKGTYINSLITSENQRKKFITTPENLENFSFQEAIPDREGGITCIFEYLELPTTYHDPGRAANLPMKWKNPEDFYYFGEDIMILNFSSTGSIAWKKVIQKTQYGHLTGQALSYVADIFNDELRLAMLESSKGNSIYNYTLDLLNGGTVAVQSFLDKKVEINKNYSRWINERTLLLCAYPEGSNKRTLYLVEF